MKLKIHQHKKNNYKNVSKNFSLIVVLLFTFIGINSCSDLDDNASVKDLKDVITRDSELFQLIEKVTTDGDNPTETIVCLDFIYPFQVLIYDSNLQQVGTQILISDTQFSSFLGQLPTNQSISISYPISTTLADGTIFSVNSNAELKLAIDSCSKEDIISYCNGLFGSETPCVWKIPYTINSDNKYASGIFEANGNGSLNFNYNGLNYTGTWVFLFVDNKLHLNINLEGTSQVALDLNIDREIQLINDDIKILSSPKPIVLRKSCQSTTVYQIGDTGTGGGLVFYDKGSYSLGWRYLEVAPTDLGFFEWGCYGSIIQNTSSQIGSGLLNSVLIANYHDSLLTYYSNPAVCNALNNGSLSSREALLLQQNNYNDWFVPSENELALLYQNLHLQGIGSFTNTLYWSSSQVDGTNAKAINFSNGISISTSKIPNPNNIKTRAIRKF
ncbi:hypothetical protein [Flavobacterium sp.]|uniref:hypothetical protein n=1 Tax=Flavobacterium sp. TaxID=239 RepID=UPI0037500CC3